MWYQAKWVDYQFEAEHVRMAKFEQNLEGIPTIPWGMNEWKPITIEQIHHVAAQNLRLTLYIPDLCGPPVVIGAGAPSLTPGLPTMTVPR